MSEAIPAAESGLQYAGLVPHVEMIHKLAEPLAGKGKLIIAAYGQDPNTGADIRPVVEHVHIGDVIGTIRHIRRLAQESCRNVYMPLAVVRIDLEAGRKGTEADIIGVLGLVADFDDADAGNYAHRLPVTAPYVLATSAGRFQAFILFDRPVSVADAKPVAQALKEFCRCDHGTADMSHVWRVPEVRNWPNKRKLDAGRSAEPQTVQVVEPWDGAVISLADLRSVLPEKSGTTERQGSFSDRTIHQQSDPRGLPDGLITNMNTAPPVGQRSDHAFGVLCALVEHGWSDEDIFDEAQKYAHGFAERYVGNEKLLRGDIARARSKAKGDRREAPNSRRTSQAGAGGNAGAPPDRMDSAEAVLRIFNQKYAVVNEAGKAVVYRPKRDEQLKRNTIERILFEDFRRMYMNQRIQAGVSKKGNPIYRDVGTVWLEHEDRRQFLGGVVMDPTNKAPADCWNLWKGFTVEPSGVTGH